MHCDNQCETVSDMPAMSTSEKHADARIEPARVVALGNIEDVQAGGFEGGFDWDEWWYSDY